MPIAVFMISGILAGILTSLARSGVRNIRQEYRNHQERKQLRRGLAERMSEHHGVPYQDIKPGKHRLDDSGAAHELCTDDHPCAHRGRRNGMVHAEFYIERAEREELARQEAEWARREAEQARRGSEWARRGSEQARREGEWARREAEEWQDIPWPRDEDCWESSRFSGLICGYDTPMSFPGLSPSSSCDYRTPSSFPGLSTPVGSSVDLTADSTSIPREPTSIGR